MAPQRDGFNVRVLDHADQSQLATKEGHPGRPQHKLDAIEAVDYVWTGQQYADLVGAAPVSTTSWLPTPLSTPPT
jgi:hypothetical protein